MTEPLVERAELDVAFADLARRLHAQGLHGELYGFGGTAMVYLGARDATHDVDSRIEGAHHALLHAPMPWRTPEGGHGPG